MIKIYKKYFNVFLCSSLLFIPACKTRIKRQVENPSPAFVDKMSEEIEKHNDEGEGDSEPIKSILLFIPSNDALNLDELDSEEAVVGGLVAVGAIAALAWAFKANEGTAIKSHSHYEPPSHVPTLEIKNPVAPPTLHITPIIRGETVKAASTTSTVSGFKRQFIVSPHLQAPAELQIKKGEEFSHAMLISTSLDGSFSRVIVHQDQITLDAAELFKSSETGVHRFTKKGTLEAQANGEELAVEIKWKKEGDYFIFTPTKIAKAAKPVVAKAAPQIVRKSLNDLISTHAAQYYSKAYSDTGLAVKYPGINKFADELTTEFNIKRFVNGKEIHVERANHGLAHASRKSAMMPHIVKAVTETSDDIAFRDFVASKIKSDPNFIEKLQLATLLSRAGRKSELSSFDFVTGAGTLTEAGKKSAQFLYDGYQFESAAIFRLEAKKSGLFKNDAEIDLYATAIIKESKDVADVEVQHINRLLDSAHRLDLIRTKKFTVGYCPNNCKEAGIAANKNIEALEKALDIKVGSYNAATPHPLWQQEEAYLKATGETIGRTGYDLKKSDEFFLQSLDPARMTRALEGATLPVFRSLP